MKTIKYGIVGVGYFGSELGRILNEQEGAKVVAVMDPDNGKTVAEEFGCDYENDLETICSREDIDAIIVATPNNLHKEPVLCAARNGKHIFCEKPIALNYHDCDEMVKVAKENNVIFMAGHVMNFFRSVRHTKKLISEGKIGKVLFAHSARNGWEEQQDSISWKKIREKSGGHLYHHIHELDCIQFIMGPAKAVTMIGGNVAHSGPQFGDEDDMLFLSLEFGNNSYAICEYGSAFRWPEHYVLIQGTEGAIRIDMCDVGMTVKCADGSEEHYTVHESEEVDEDRKKIYHSTEMDGAIQYGHPGKKPPMWLHGIMRSEMIFFNNIMHGEEVSEEFRPLMTGEAARASIATADAATLSLKGISKVYSNGVEAVKDFNLDIEDKEFIIFVGPSGCGKSTTLRMIAGLENISSGTLEIDGKVMNNVEPKDRDIAMVFQNYALYPHMTVYDNMAFGLKLRKTSKEEIAEKVKAAAQILGLESLLDRKPKALSGGQRQRVAMGRAIVRNPKVFLMDEPLSNLDAKLRVQMRAEIAALHQRLGTTVIYVTHDQTEAMTLGTRIVVMKDGVIQQVDTPQKLYDEPTNLFVAGFMGSPQMNFLDAKVEKDGELAVLNLANHKIKLNKIKSDALLANGYEGKEVIIGIRPEHFIDNVKKDDNKNAVFNSKVEVYELLGAEVFLYFKIGEKIVIARVEPNTSARLGSEIDIAMDVDKIHVFDKNTERTITN